MEPNFSVQYPKYLLFEEINMNPILLHIFLFYALLINLFGFLLMVVDKRRAQRGKWRIPEAVLFLFAFLGGSVGCYLGMQIMRHKTKHPLFQLGIPLIFFLQGIILSYLFLSTR
jgi:uncharacterized membrane protein YsdA (DUF1294 family)